MRSIAVILFAYVAVTGCEPSAFGDCTGTAIDEAISPDGRYVATLFHGECSAVPELRSGLSLREARAGFDPSEQRPFLTLEGHRSIEFEWSSARSLRVALPRSNAALEQEETWRDVRIDYE